MYKVMVDDNFNFMDDEERYCAGTFDTLEQAEQKCKQMLDEEIAQYTQTHPGEEFETWISFGESPFVQGSKFSAYKYVKEQCSKL